MSEVKLDPVNTGNSQSVQEERKNRLLEERRRHKEVLWNNKYYVLYKILLVVCVTMFLCFALYLGNR